MRVQIPVWTYEDLALFLAAVLPSLAVAAVVTRPLHIPGEGARTMLFQAVFYLLLLGALYALIAIRYGQPLWRSLGWTFEFPGVWLCFAAGPVLAIGLAALAAALRAPNQSVIPNLVTDRLSRALVMLFVTLFGPVFEEIVFRGFLLPLFARSVGAVPAIFLSALPFALLHGVQYHWAWQSMVVVGVAGLVFGFARVRTGSTAASALIHAGYNSTLFGVYLVQQWPVAP